jgi:hypothetical protein
MALASTFGNMALDMLVNFGRDCVFGHVGEGMKHR